ncbi:hypothetical protein B0W47_16595 (plasmid) [Komagataeibacter nataicola]|nr:hypothetical protein B0W47_16595 [Komagataeibacter nataicola]
MPGKVKTPPEFEKIILYKNLRSGIWSIRQEGNMPSVPRYDAEGEVVGVKDRLSILDLYIRSHPMMTEEFTTRDGTHVPSVEMKPYEKEKKAIRILAFELYGINMLNKRERQDYIKRGLLLPDVTEETGRELTQSRIKEYNDMSPAGNGARETLRSLGMNDDVIRDLLPKLKETGDGAIVYPVFKTGEQVSYEAITLEQGNRYQAQSIGKIGDDDARVKIIARDMKSGFSAYQDFKKRGMIKNPDEVQILVSSVDCNTDLKSDLADLIHDSRSNAVFVVARDAERYPVYVTGREGEKKEFVSYPRDSDLFANDVADAIKVSGRKSVNMQNPPRTHRTWSNVADGIVVDHGYNKIETGELLNKLKGMQRQDAYNVLNEVFSERTSDIGHTFATRKPTPDVSDMVRAYEQVFQDRVLAVESSVRTMHARPTQHSNSIISKSLPAEDLEKVIARNRARLQGNFDRREPIPNDDPYLLSRGILPATIAAFNQSGDIRRDRQDYSGDRCNPEGFVVAHRDAQGGLSGYERKGPKPPQTPENIQKGVNFDKSFSIFVAGGTKLSTQLRNGDAIERAYVGESVVDLLSAWQHDGSPENSILMSVYGNTSEHAHRVTAQVISEGNPQASVYLCFDNDSAGNTFSEKFRAIAPKGLEVFDHHPPAEYKDWNDCIQGKLWKQDTPDALWRKFSSNVPDFQIVELKEEFGDQIPQDMIDQVNMWYPEEIMEDDEMDIASKDDVEKIRDADNEQIVDDVIDDANDDTNDRALSWLEEEEDIMSSSHKM